ncbi:glutathione S-transferase family protein [Iodobacter sp. CM08]|uniref:glutathione S-transferase family protein n=1 Tax=Iodobacter sp. CM08 TaxID=3085902 RepID=UPI0029824087|nr:glutathione S-transferase family protein [Iodobacter sp. CM08]MDW5415786.1 glutathione S-transferase family protein [Iodobacter sp. CM08]
MMMTLYAFGPAFGLPDMSPFVTKAELLLKMAKCDYQTNRHGYAKAPKGKLPYLQTDNALIDDSTLIRFYLEQDQKIDFDAALSPSERGIAWAFEKMLEEHLYYISLKDRWANDENFAKGPGMIFKHIPWPIRGLVIRQVRQKMNRKLQIQGIALHKESDIIKLAKKDLDSLADFLADKPYLMGDQPCAADASVYAFMRSALCPLFDSATHQHAISKANLIAYCDRMTKEFYPEAHT